MLGILSLALEEAVLRTGASTCPCVYLCIMGAENSYVLQPDCRDKYLPTSAVLVPIVREMAVRNGNCNACAPAVYDHSWESSSLPHLRDSAMAVW
jgi:hypothetical protein